MEELAPGFVVAKAPVAALQCMASDRRRHSEREVAKPPLKASPAVTVSITFIENGEQIHFHYLIDNKHFGHRA